MVVRVKEFAPESFKNKSTIVPRRNIHNYAVTLDFSKVSLRIFLERDNF